MLNETLDVKSSLLMHREEFETVYGIISTHRKRVLRTINNESMTMVWEVGGYVSHKLKTTAWGDGVVRQLSDYIRTKEPTARGWSYRTLYKMVQLYETYSSASFSELIENTDMSAYGGIVPFETAQKGGEVIVPFGMAQIPKVRYALNRSMSPTMVALYKEQLQVGSVIQRSLVEFCKFLNENGRK